MTCKNHEEHLYINTSENKQFTSSLFSCSLNGLFEQCTVYWEHRGVETILKVEGHDSYEIKNGGPGVTPGKILQTTPVKLRENDTTPSYYA